jgi:hypothetical protein
VTKITKSFTRETKTVAKLFVEPKICSKTELLAALELVRKLDRLSGSERLFELKNGNWAYTEFAENSKPLTVQNLVFEAVAHLDGAARIEAKKALYAQIQNHVPSLKPNAQSAGRRPDKDTKQEQKTQTTADYSLPFRSYFVNKGGISERTLRAAGVLQLLQYKGFNYSEPVALYGSGLVCKLFEVNKDKRRFNGVFDGLQTVLGGFFGCLVANKPLVICEGETDTLAVIEAGFSAVSLGSAAAANNLQTISAAAAALGLPVLVWADFDTAGGKVREKAAALGLPFIHEITLNIYFENEGITAQNVNDVCGLWAALYKLGLSEGEPEQSAARITTEMLGAFIGDCFELYGGGSDKPKAGQSMVVNKYVSEALDNLHKALVLHNRIAVVSAAGSGKSYFVAELYKKIKAENQAARFLFLAPTQSIAEQLSKEFSEISGEFCGLLRGGLSDTDRQKSASSNICAAVYNSAEKFHNLNDHNLYIILDEFDQLGREYSYRKPDGQFRFVHKLLSGAKNAVLLSATPDELFYTDAFIGKGFWPIRIEQQKKNKICMHFIKVQNTKAAVLDLAERGGAGMCLIKCDNNTTLKAYQDFFTKRGAKCEHFTSADKERKDYNTNYQSLMSSGELADKDIDILLFTRLLEAGVSLKFQVGKFGIFDTQKSWRSLLQLAARPRYDYKTGTNKDINVYVYYTKDNPSECEPLNALDLIEKTKIVAARLNAAIRGNELEKKDFKTSFDKRFVYLCKDSGLWKVDYLEIANKAIESEEQTSSINDIAAKIGAADNRFSFVFEDLVNSKNIELEELAKLKKEEKETVTAQGLEALQDNKDLALYCGLSQLRDKAKRYELVTAFNLNYYDKFTQSEFAEKYKQVFRTNFFPKFTVNVHKLLSAGETIQAAFEAAISETSTAITQKADTLKIKNRVKLWKSAKTENQLNAADKAAAAVDYQNRNKLKYFVEKHKERGTVWPLALISEKLGKGQKETRRYIEALGFELCEAREKKERLGYYVTKREQVQ